jgi:hypothetical protein
VTQVQRCYWVIQTFKIEKLREAKGQGAAERELKVTKKRQKKVANPIKKRLSQWFQVHAPMKKS